MALALLPPRITTAGLQRVPQSQAGPRQRRVRSRVAFTRIDSALEEMTGAQLKAQPQVVVREPSPPESTPVDADQLQQLLLKEYKRGYEAGMASSSRDSPGPEKELVHDSVTRTALKSLTWRVLSTATTVTLALVLFNDSIAADAAVELGAVEFLSKYGLYFVHERAWAAITFLL